MIYILSAAYNEEKDLPGLLNEIHAQNWQWPYKIILVNDGSTDKTCQVAEQFQKSLPITILNHPENSGLGKALNTGLEFIHKVINDDDLMVTMDADNTHQAESIPQLKDKIESGLDLVIASRFCKGGKQHGLKFIRKLLSQNASFLLKFVWPIKGVNDYTSGYRIFSGRLIRKLFNTFGDNVVTENGFSATLEIILKASRCTDKISEIPLSLHYERKSGPSKMKVLNTIRQYLVLILKQRF